MLIGPPSDVTSRVRRRRLFSVICVTFYSSTVTIRMFRGILQPIKLGDACVTARKPRRRAAVPDVRLEVTKRTYTIPCARRGDRVRQHCGFSGHASMFVDRRDGVNGERLWTFRAGGFAAGFCCSGSGGALAQIAPLCNNERACLISHLPSHDSSTNFGGCPASAKRRRSGWHFIYYAWTANKRSRFRMRSAKPRSESANARSATTSPTTIRAFSAPASRATGA